MTSPKIISERSINLAELKEEIDKIKKRDKEPGLRVQKTEEYLNYFTHLKLGNVKKLKEKIIKLNIPRLKEDHTNKIVDIMPKTVDDLKSLLQGYLVTVSKDNMTKIIGVVNEFGTGKEK